MALHTALCRSHRVLLPKCGSVTNKSTGSLVRGNCRQAKVSCAIYHLNDIRIVRNLSSVYYACLISILFVSKMFIESNFTVALRALKAIIPRKRYHAYTYNKCRLLYLFMFLVTPSILRLCVPGGTGESHGSSNQDSPCSDPDLRRDPLEYVGHAVA